MISVLAETAYPASAPSSRVRVAAFVPQLAEQGIDMSYAPTLTDEEYALMTSGAAPWRKGLTLARAAMRLARSRRDQTADLKLLQRLRFPAPLPLLDPPRHIDVYDFDDALYVGSIGAVNRRFAAFKREAARWHAYVRRARVVIAGNSILADHVRGVARRVEVVPTCVDASDQPLRKHEDGKPVTIGWIGSRTTSPYVETTGPLVEDLRRRGLDARLVLVGADPKLGGPQVEVRRWSLEREKADLASFDIGVMPLPDDEWARGKCGYKLLQYFAAGVPAVASPVGITPKLIGEDRGFVARDREEWLDALATLGRDAVARREMGLRARAFVEGEYSYERWAPELASILREL